MESRRGLWGRIQRPSDGNLEIRRSLRPGDPIPEHILRAAGQLRRFARGALSFRDGASNRERWQSQTVVFTPAQISAIIEASHSIGITGETYATESPYDIGVVEPARGTVPAARLDHQLQTIAGRRSLWQSRVDKLVIPGSWRPLATDGSEQRRLKNFLSRNYPKVERSRVDHLLTDATTAFELVSAGAMAMLRADGYEDEFVEQKRGEQEPAMIRRLQHADPELPPTILALVPSPDPSWRARTIDILRFLQRVPELEIARGPSILLTGTRINSAASRMAAEQVLGLPFGCETEQVPDPTPDFQRALVNDDYPYVWWHTPARFIREVNGDRANALMDVVRRHCQEIEAGTGAAFDLLKFTHMLQRGVVEIDGTRRLASMTQL